MNKYIDADKLIAEIKRLQQQNDTSEDKDYPQYELDVACGYDMACDEILKLIDSLQQEQPEEDLEKEYKTWWDSISGKINVEHIMEWYMHETARHFYELGKNARKGDK